MSKTLILEKYIKVAVRKALKEQEQQQRRAEKAMYLVYRFPGLKKLMEELMSPSFGRFVSGINIVAPKPTIFRVELINGQEFTITYLGSNNYSVKVAGKKYFDKNISEIERASRAISQLLELNYLTPEAEAEAEGGSKSSKSSSSTSSTPSTSSKDQELAADLAAASSPAAEAPPTEPEPPAEEEETPAE
jgi:hypothetical protein